MSTLVLRLDDGVLVDLHEEEAALLDALLAELAGLVAPPSDAEHADPLAAMVGIGTSTHLPLDPDLARLLPDAYADAVAAGDFRRFTEDRLREQKRASAEAVRERLAGPAPYLLDDGEVLTWMRALNDLRLVLGTRLDVQEEDDEDERILAADGVRYGHYLWLTDLQAALVDALEDTLDEGPDGPGRD